MTPSPSTAARVDQAAVLGVVLAASVTISTAGEAWELIESVVGIVLLMLIAAYFETAGIDGVGSVRKRLAWAAVSALCCCIVVAYPIQYVTEAPLAELTLPIVWLVATAAFMAYLTVRERARHTAAEPEPELEAELGEANDR